MTALRKRLITYLQSQEMSTRTQKVYVRAVRQLAEYYNLSPDKITDEQIRQYLVSLKEQKHLSEGTVMQLLCGIKLFSTQILGRPLKVRLKEPAYHSGQKYFPSADKL